MQKQDFIESIRLEGEEWKPIPNYDGVYYASTFGRLVSFCQKQPKILKIVIQKNKGKAYAYVCLKGTKVRVHRLIALTFIPNPDNLKEIDHIDGDGTNNIVSNLRWCDRTTNLDNPIARRRMRSSHRNRPQDKGIFDRVIEQVKDGVVVAVFQGTKELKEQGYNSAAVSHACRGLWSQYRGYKWRYRLIKETTQE